MIKMVVFDMAGTTVDEGNVVYKTGKAINDQGYDFTLEEVLAEGAGKEKLQAIRSVLASRGIEDESLSRKIFGQFEGELDEAYGVLPVRAQPNATRLFEELRTKGVFVVLNTGYSREVAEKLLDKLGWQVGRAIDATIDVLITASDVPRNRPHPDMITRAMEELGVSDASAVVKVGDSAIDIEEGKNAGCKITVGITTGAQTKEQLLAAKPTAVIDDLMDLLEVIG